MLPVGYRAVVTRFAFSPDGQTAAVVAGSTLWLLDADTGKALWSAREREIVNSVEFSPDGRTILLATGSRDAVPGELKVYDVRTGQAKLALKRHAAPVSSACFSPDGEAIATASRDGTVKLWSAR